MNEKQKLYTIITAVNKCTRLCTMEPSSFATAKTCKHSTSHATMRKVMGDKPFEAAVNNAIKKSVRSTDKKIQNLFATAPETSE